jgi:hypothetical protein
MQSIVTRSISEAMDVSVDTVKPQLWKKSTTGATEIGVTERRMQRLRRNH